MIFRIYPYYCPKCKCYKPKRKVYWYRGVIAQCDSCGTELFDVKHIIRKNITAIMDDEYESYRKDKE